MNNEHPIAGAYPLTEQEWREDGGKLEFFKDKEDTPEKYIANYTTRSFTGLEAITVVNGQVIGEINEVFYKEVFGVMTAEQGEPFPQRVQGYMDVIIFDREPPIRKAINGNFDEFVILFGNEYGDKFSIQFPGFALKERTANIRPDTMMMYERYHFGADAIHMSNTPWVVEDTPEGKRYVCPKDEDLLPAYNE